MATSKPGKKIRIQAIIPEEWFPRLKALMERKGYYSVSEFIRDLIRREIGAEK